jgi:LmbE family N-acetylglucosaminyl deacetylase
VIRGYLRDLYRRVLPPFYGRRQFKLFLKASLGDIDLRMLALASQTDYFSGFVRAIPIHAPFGKSMLVVAPHQDDETIGCGGALALQIDSGAAATVVVLQDGADEFERAGISRQALMEKRNEESRRAAAVIGLPVPVFQNHPVLAAAAPQVAEMVDLLLQLRADAVFVPFVLDGHPDHRTANYILAAGLRKIPWNVRVFCYEVWGFCIPNVVVVIDEVIEKKIEALRCFRFANSALDYTNSTLGLNMFNSRMLGAGQCRYAERFFEIPRKEYIELVERVRAGETEATGRRAMASRQ